MTNYNPPYDSPIEDVFAWGILKHMDTTTELKPQVEAKTICGTFVLDFVATTTCGRKVGFECDGKEFHDTYRDEWRDAMILGAVHVDSIIRMRGCDLHHQINNVLWIASEWEPSVFSDRGHANLSFLRSDGLNHEFGLPGDSLFVSHLYRSDDSNCEEPSRIKMFRRTLNNPPTVKRQMWQSYFRFAKGIGGGNLDSAIDRYRSQNAG